VASSRQPVYLVGAGPGDPGLITRRGAELLRRADVVVYDGLVGGGVLELLRPDCERVYAGKKHSGSGVPLAQEEINELLVERARAGRCVVRLKGGDPFVFGRGAEEGRALARAGVAFEVVPGVSAAAAVPAYAGIPLTARGVSSTIAFATGHEAAGKPESDVEWEALARAGTIVLFMAVKTLHHCAERLIAAGKSPAAPAAVIYWGTTASQRCVTAPLGELAVAVESAGLKPPALVVIGEVVAMRAELAWFEERPLSGQRVLLTRGGGRADLYAAAIAELGAETITAALTRQVDPEPADTARARAAVRKIEEYDWVLFASAYAVERFFLLLDERGADARALAGARLACVGAATAAALAARGLRSDLTPERGDAAGLARAVLAVSTEPNGMRVLLPRAAEGRLEAATALTAAGAAVDAIALYRTVTAPADDVAVAHALELFARGAVSAAAFFAPSQVAALFALAGEESARETLRRCRAVVALGKTTQAALESRGVGVTALPEKPNAAALAAALAAATSSPDRPEEK
jgi:uroporphyrinogen III methyltransferase/synthase